MTTIRSTENIQVANEDGITTILLNRPDRLNALDPDTHHQLQELLLQVDQDEATKVVVLTGAGRGFCAGGDTKSMGERHKPAGAPSHVYSMGRHLINAFNSVEKPIVAMVNGPAAGLGATIALYCDVVFMAEDAVIGDRHVNVGLVAGDGGAVLWPLLVGPLRAKEMLMTGRMLSGTEAAEIGLVNRAVPQDDLHEQTYAFAKELTELPPYALRATKASINRVVHFFTNLVLEPSLAWEKISMMSEDHQEALQARAEKRPGNYTGR